VADLDNDGKAEVIFTSWPQKGAAQVGQLHILDYLGNTLHAIDLPPSFPAGGVNGGLAAPTLANLDADADLELVIGTIASGAVAYDLPNTSNARVLWGTGRGSPLRAGTPSTPACYALTLVASPAGAGSLSASTPNCGSGYAPGSVVTLTAAPNAGNTFLGWSGVPGASPVVTLTLNADRSMTAYFLTFTPAARTLLPLVRR
jgi:hypothetical protein